jgi:hypothetical protein
VSLSVPTETVEFVGAVLFQNAAAPAVLASMLEFKYVYFVGPYAECWTAQF